MIGDVGVIVADWALFWAGITIGLAVAWVIKP